MTPNTSNLCAGTAGIDITPDRLLYLDLKGYLGEGVLMKVDRASMACSLEVRVPFLDRAVVELAAGLPSELKLRRFTTKYILKKAFDGALPLSVLRVGRARGNGRRELGVEVPVRREVVERPHTFGQSREVRGAERGGLLHDGPRHGHLELIGLQLQQQIHGRCAPVGP